MFVAPPVDRGANKSANFKSCRNEKQNSSFRENLTRTKKEKTGIQTPKMTSFLLNSLNGKEMKFELENSKSVSKPTAKPEPDVDRNKLEATHQSSAYCDSNYLNQNNSILLSGYAPAPATSCLYGLHTETTSLPCQKKSSKSSSLKYSLLATDHQQEDEKRVSDLAMVPLETFLNSQHDSLVLTLPTFNVSDLKSISKGNDSAINLSPLLLPFSDDSSDSSELLFPCRSMTTSPQRLTSLKKSFEYDDDDDVENIQWVPFFSPFHRRSGPLVCVNLSPQDIIHDHQLHSTTTEEAPKRKTTAKSHLSIRSICLPSPPPTRTSSLSAKTYNLQTLEQFSTLIFESFSASSQSTTTTTTGFSLFSFFSDSGSPDTTTTTTTTAVAPIYDPCKVASKNMKRYLEETGGVVLKKKRTFLKSSSSVGSGLHLLRRSRSLHSQSGESNGVGTGTNHTAPPPPPCPPVPVLFSASAEESKGNQNWKKIKTLFQVV